MVCVVSLLTALAITVRATDAAFTATTGNSGNSWGTGALTLTADHPAAAVFTATGLAPGNTASRCVNVTYTGPARAEVELYVASLTGSGGAGGTGLGQDLAWSATQGSGAARRRVGGLHGLHGGGGSDAVRDHGRLVRGLVVVLRHGGGRVGGEARRRHPQLQVHLHHGQRSERAERHSIDDAALGGPHQHLCGGGDGGQPGRVLAVG